MGAQAQEVPEEAQQGQAVLAPGCQSMGQRAMLEAARARASQLTDRLTAAEARAGRGADRATGRNAKRGPIRPPVEHGAALLLTAYALRVLSRAGQLRS